MSVIPSQTLSQRPHKKLWVGYSLTRDLARFVQVHTPNFNLPRYALDLQFLGIGGLKIKQLTSDHVISRIRTFQPATLVLTIGDNDLDHLSVLQTISNRILVSCRRRRFSTTLLFLLAWVSRLEDKLRTSCNFQAPNISLH